MSLKPESQKQRALITGASSGIGYALAHEFAKLNFDLTLVARDKERLELLSLNLKSKYPLINITVIAKDLSLKESPPEIVNLSPPFTVLVNNAGFGVHGPFSETDLSLEENLIELQILGVLRLTKLAINAWSDNLKDSEAIINIASIYSYAPVPNQSVYSASKAFMHSFTNSLATELSESGIRVLGVYPGSTKTEFRSRSGIKSNNGMSAEAVAQATVKAYLKKKQRVVPGFINKFFVLFSKFLSSQIKSRIMVHINKARGV